MGRDPETLTRLKQLQQRLQDLSCLQEALVQENCQLQGVVGSLADAVRKREAARRAMQRLSPLFGGALPPPPAPALARPSVAQLLSLLPTSAAAAARGRCADSHLHRSVAGLTPAAAAARWNEAVRDLRLLLYLNSRDPAGSQRELSATVRELLRFSCALYMFAPEVLCALRGVDLLTMRHAAAPPGHWAAAWECGALDGEKRAQIAAVLAFCGPRLRRLAVQAEGLRAELAALDLAAAAAAERPPRPPGAAAGFLAASSAIERRRWQAAQQLARNSEAQRVLTQTRSQLVVHILEPAQAARIVVAVHPFMLLGSPLYDHLPAPGGPGARAAAPAESSSASPMPMPPSPPPPPPPQQAPPHKSAAGPAVLPPSRRISWEAEAVVGDNYSHSC